MLRLSQWYRMPFRTFGIWIFCLILISGCGEKGSRNRPNIIFFIADDMYPEMFNCLPAGRGKNLTPNLDRLAAEGTVLVNQYVVSPVCTPSRFNCLTGKYASRATNEAFLRKTRREEGQTVIQWNTFITGKDTILTHYLNQAGYATGMVGKNHVIEARELYQFPDYFADPQDPEIRPHLEENYEKVRGAVLESGFDYAGGLYHNNPRFIGLQELAVQNLDWMTEAGIDFIDRHRETPFFLYFATTVPHGPTDAEHSWNADPRITARGILDEPPQVLPPRHTLPQRLEEAGLGGMDKENILWLDDALGALIERLETHGILENTVIFFFNDHGQDAKGTLYQGGVHNPSIVWRHSGFPCGETCNALVSNVDFLPTILEIAEFNGETGNLDGYSFLPALEGESAPVRTSLYFELGYSRAVIKPPFKYYAVRFPDYAMNWTMQERAEVLEGYNNRREMMNMEVVNRDPSKPFSHLEVVPGGGHAEHASYGLLPGYFDSDQLYHLDQDPEEQNNLADDPAYQEVLRDMKETLNDYLTDLPGRFQL